MWAGRQGPIGDALVLWEWEIHASLAEGSLGYFVGRDFGAHMVVPSW